GHGTDNAWDEAAALVLHAVRLPPGGGAPGLGRRVGRTAQARARALVTRRIRERIPAAYLTGVAWFAGVPLHVDARVLVPRSPIRLTWARASLPGCLRSTGTSRAWRSRPAAPGSTPYGSSCRRRAGICGPAECSSSRWATPSARCDGHSGACPSCGLNSRAAG